MPHLWCSEIRGENILPLDNINTDIETNIFVSINWLGGFTNVLWLWEVFITPFWPGCSFSAAWPVRSPLTTTYERATETSQQPASQSGYGSSIQIGFGAAAAWIAWLATQSLLTWWRRVVIVSVQLALGFFIYVAICLTYVIHTGIDSLWWANPHNFLKYVPDNVGR